MCGVGKRSAQPKRPSDRKSDSAEQKRSLLFFLQALASFRAIPPLCDLCDLCGSTTTVGTKTEVSRFRDRSAGIC
jgi:hypothetical protein